MFRKISTAFLLFVTHIGSYALADNSSAPKVRVDQASIPKVDSLWTRLRGADWPRMLGANYDSRSTENGILKKWPASGLRVVWTIDTGVGYGNGVAAAGRWFQFDRFNDVQRLTCYNAESGASIWNWECPVEYRDAYGYNNGPRCSPVVDDRLVYVFGVDGTLACISIADGKEVWQRKTKEEYGVIQNFFGVGASPLVYQDKLIAMIGGSPVLGSFQNAKPAGTAMVAFDKFTGRELYRVGNYLASYSAPVIHTIDGKDWCLAFVREGLMAFDPSDGTKETFIPWRSAEFESVNASSPILWNDCIFISECYELGTNLLQFQNEKLVSVFRDLPGRKDKLVRTHWSTPLIAGNRMLASSGRNEPDTDMRLLQLTSASPIKPEVIWTQRNRDRVTGLVVEDHAIVLGEYGALQLIDMNRDRYEAVAQMDLGQTTDKRDQNPLIEPRSWAPPVLSHGLLMIRGANKVVCLDLIPN
jgi:outer membrane protein assembly factor BamB